VTNFAPTNILTFIDAGNGDTTNIVVVFTTEPTASTNIVWTDPVPFTNTFTFDNPNFTVTNTTAEVFNSVSFKGKVKGSKLTFVGTTSFSSGSFGKLTYQGVPLVLGTDISGSWFGTKVQEGQPFNEFFTLIPVTSLNPFPVDFPDLSDFPNVYATTDGAGPGYEYVGVVIASPGHKQMGFVATEQPAGRLRALIGPLNTKNGVSTKMQGVIDPTTNIRYTATLLAPLE
jgi:hypothetical protein